MLTGAVKEALEKDIRGMSEWLGCEVEEIRTRLDHIHLMVSIPPKISISDSMGTVKGKTAIKLFKNNPGMRVKPYWGNHLWALGYFVNTTGIDEETIRKYVKYQEKEENREERQQGSFRFFRSAICFGSRRLWRR